MPSGSSVNMSHTEPPGGRACGADGARDGLVREVEHGQLELSGLGELVDEHQHGFVGDVGDVDLRARGDAVVAAHGEDRLELADEAGFVLELLGDGAVEAAAARHARVGLPRAGGDAHEVVGGAVDPARVAALEQLGHLVRGAG